MGLENTQRVLARLYTGAEARTAFFADPDAVGLEWGLDPDDVAQVSRVSQAQVSLFANSLHGKRLGEVRKLLPLTFRAGGQEWDNLFRRYAENYVPSGVKKHRIDALAFAVWACRNARGKPSWQRDLVRYEAAWLMAAPRQVCLVRRFSCSIAALVQALGRGEVPKPSGASVAFWIRLTPRSRLRHFVVPISIIPQRKQTL